MRYSKVMIRRARELSFSPMPRCPVCAVGVLPYGNNEPFVVSDDGRVYCREHGLTADAKYGDELASYRARREQERREAIDALEDEWRPRPNGAK